MCPAAGTSIQSLPVEVTFRAVPPIGFESNTVQQIAAEFEKIATALRGWPTGESTSSRGQNPAQQILQALRKINTTLTQGARDRTLGASAFNDMGREFEAIGKALRDAAGGSKST